MLDDGRKDRPKHVYCYFKINRFVKLVPLVGFTIETFLNFGRTIGIFSASVPDIMIEVLL